MGLRRRKERDARGSIARLAGASYFTAALGILTGPIVARALGPAERGEYASVMVYTNFATAIFSFGVAVALSHALNNRLAEPAALLGAILRFAAVLVIPAVVAATVVVTVVLTDLSEVARWTCFALIGATPVAVVGLCLQSFILNRGALERMTELTVTPILFNAVAVVVLAAFGVLDLATYLAITIVGIVFTWFVAWRAVRLRPAKPAPLKPLLRFGSRAYVGSLAHVANLQLDQVLLAPLLGFAELGYYAIAVSIAGLPIALSSAIASRTWGNVSGADDLMSGEASRLIRMTVVVSCIIAAAIAAATPVFVPLLYGAAFKPTVLPLLFLLPGSVAVCIGGVVGVCLIIAGRPGVTSSAQLVALVITVVGLALFVGRYGIKGAACVTTVAYVTRVSIQVVVLRRLGVKDMRPGRGDVATVTRAVTDRIPRWPRRRTDRVAS